MPRGLARVALAVARASSFAGTGLLYLFMGAFVVSGFIAAWYITIPLVLAPYLLAAAGRRGELRADQQSAALGFAPEMAQVLPTSRPNRTRRRLTPPRRARSSATRRAGQAPLQPPRQLHPAACSGALPPAHPLTAAGYSRKRRRAPTP
ncbi:hypothetical protein ACFQ93_15650 [Streptomyces sp. NPDC056601]|uniref:hypothetical protein n=1 Tax=Streptomyces sp. NPDC056601 TaxID=3345875 RepID=UPI0036ACA175